MNLKILCLNLIIDLLLIRTTDERSVLVRDEDLPPIDERKYKTSNKRIRTRINTEFSGRGSASEVYYLKLAIYYDQYLLTRFGGNEDELKKFVSSLLYSSQIFFNRDNIREFANIKLLVVKYAMYPGQTSADNTTNKIDGNNTKLLKDFCRYNELTRDESQQNAAILLSGLNIWSFNTTTTTDKDLGLSYQNEICNPLGCAIVETREFFSANIFTHELGHILSLNHDGEDGEGCHPNKYIMTAQYSMNRINDWSDCSAQQLRGKLTNMRNENRIECLKNKAVVIPGFDFSNQRLPGVVWPVDKQCEVALGPYYRAITSPPNNDICRSLLCRSRHNWFERKRGFPALEGTFCGTKWQNGNEILHYCWSDLCTTRSIVGQTENRINNRYFIISNNLTQN